MNKIHEDLNNAEELISKALGKMVHIKSPQRTNSRMLYIGKIVDVYKCSSLLLKVRSLKNRLKTYDL